MSAGAVHIEPMGVYSKKVKNLTDLKKGASVAIPNDPTNGGRALQVLAAAGLIKMKDGVGVNGTPLDITDNPKRIRIVEVEAATLPRALDDLDAAVINSNYALGAKLNPTKDAIAIEAKDSPYANVVAVRAGDENKPAIFIRPKLRSLLGTNITEPLFRLSKSLIGWTSKLKNLENYF